MPSSASRPLLDAPDRSYADKLSRFDAFARPELSGLIRDLAIGADHTVCDLGCGTGGATALLRAAARSGAVIGLDISRGHCRHAHAEYPDVPVIVADLEAPPVAPGSFDWLWLANTIHHVADPAGTLRHLRQYLKPGGRMVLGQSSLLPDMVLAWDAHLEREITEACHRFYREKYHLRPEDTASVRALVGTARQAGLSVLFTRSISIERVQPLSAADRRYLHDVVLHGYWGAKLRPFLTGEAWDQLAALIDPDAPGYCLDRPDFHFIQLFSVVVAR